MAVRWQGSAGFIQRSQDVQDGTISESSELSELSESKAAGIGGNSGGGLPHSAASLADNTARSGGGDEPPSVIARRALLYGPSCLRICWCLSRGAAFSADRLSVLPEVA